nr:MAG TPA: hypothetical protein [Caudoviricetes sp.]
MGEIEQTVTGQGRRKDKSLERNFFKHLIHKEIQNESKKI